MRHDRGGRRDAGGNDSTGAAVAAASVRRSSGRPAGPETGRAGSGGSSPGGRPPPFGDPARGRPRAGRRDRPSPGTHGAACSAGGPASPSSNDSAVERLLVARPRRAPGASRPPGPPGPPPPRPTGRSRRSRPPRRASPSRPARRRPRTGRRSGRARAPAASSRAIAWSSRRPAGDSRTPAWLRGRATRRPRRRVRLHHHARAAAERVVVDRAGGGRARVPDVVEPNVDEPARRRLAQEALAQRAVEIAGEEREDVDPDSRSAPSVRGALGTRASAPRGTVIPASASTAPTRPRSRRPAGPGRASRPRPRRAAQTSLAAVCMTSAIRPSAAPPSVTTSQPTSWWGQYSPSGSGGTDAEGTNRYRPRQALGRVPVHDALEPDQQTLAVRPGRGDGERALGPADQSRSRDRTGLEPRESGEDGDPPRLHPVRPGDPPDGHAHGGRRGGSPHDLD